MLTSILNLIAFNEDDSGLYLAFKNNRPDKFDELLANGADVDKLLPEYFNGTILHCMTAWPKNAKTNFGVYKTHFRCR